jgi:hypothetical protein
MFEPRRIGALSGAIIGFAPLNGKDFDKDR